MPVLGSIVQKGKLAACALSPPVSALKRVDLPAERGGCGALLVSRELPPRPLADLDWAALC